LADTGSHSNITCATGKVVDSKLTAEGVKGLRFVDASIFSSHVSLHFQAALFAVAEKAENMIVDDSKAQAEFQRRIAFTRFIYHETLRRDSSNANGSSLHVPAPLSQSLFQFYLQIHC